MTGRNARSPAEWVSFGVCCVILIGVIGLIAVQIKGPQEPAAPIAVQSGAVREAVGRFFVPVEVVNEGDRTAAEVQVTAELAIAGKTTNGEQTINFLAGDETERLMFAFDSDPNRGDLVIRVTGFAIP